MQYTKIILHSSFIFFVLALAGCATQSETQVNDQTENTVQRMTSKNPQNNFSAAQKNQIIELKNGDTYDLTAEYVNQEINGNTYKMLAYNGSIPGPTLKVPQGSEIAVNFTNNTDIPTSIHSHGLRLEDKFDGVVDVHQPAVEQGKSFTYKLKFPDAGLYWYHPHLHEPYTQSHGLYGAYLVVPTDKNYWSPVNEEVPLMLNDISIKNGQMENFNPKVTRFALMGEFGNTMLVNGVTDYQKNFQTGEVVRFYIANASNTRPYNLSIPNVKMKLVGGDSGKYEHETWQDHIVLSPSERAIVEVLFDKSGTYTLQNTNPQNTYNLATFRVSEEKVSQSFAKEFNVLRNNKDVIADIDKFRDAFNKKPDKSLTLTMEMKGMGNMQNTNNMGEMSHGSHMMGNGQMMTNSSDQHMMPDGQMMSNSTMGNNMGQHMMPNGQMMSNSMMMNNDKDPIEWEDTMSMMNSMSTTDTVKWKMVDDETKKENMNIDWKFKVGDQVKVKIFNDPNSMHPMQHPIHFHGQRFLVLSTNGVKNTNLVWKDTALVPKGATVEILIDMSNPGKWMAHCHISEHLASSMMIPFEVQ